MEIYLYVSLCPARTALPFRYLFYVPDWDNSFASRKHLPPYPVFVTMVIPWARRRRNGSSGMDRIGFLVNDGMTRIGRWHSMFIGSADPSLQLSLTLLLPLAPDWEMRLKGRRVYLINHKKPNMPLIVDQPRFSRLGEWRPLLNGN